MPEEAVAQAEPEVRPRPVVVLGAGWTLFNGDPLWHLARSTDAWPKVRELLTPQGHDREGAQGDALEGILACLEGEPVSTVEAIAQDLLARPAACDALPALERRGFALGAVTDVRPVAERAERCFGLDFAASPPLELDADHRLTGALERTRFQGDCGRKLARCAVVEALADVYGAPNVVAVGAGPEDACMLDAADLGIAIERACETAKAAADAIAALRDLPTIVDAEGLGIEPGPVDIRPRDDASTGSKAPGGRGSLLEAAAPNGHR